MIKSFDSQLRRLEKRLEYCSKEKHKPSCLCPWALDDEEPCHPDSDELHVRWGSPCHDEPVRDTAPGRGKISVPQAAKGMRKRTAVVHANPVPEPLKPRVRPGFTWEDVYVPPAPSLPSSTSSDSESLPCWQIHHETPQHKITSVTQPARREIQSQICHQRREIITSHADHEPPQRREIASEGKRSDTARVTRSPEPEVTSQPKFPVWEIYRSGLSPPRKSVQPQRKWTSTVRITSTRTFKNNLDFFTNHFKSPGSKSPDEYKNTVSPAHSRPQSVPRSRGTQTATSRARHASCGPSKVSTSPRARYLTSGPNKVPNSPRERHVTSWSNKVSNFLRERHVTSGPNKVSNSIRERRVTSGVTSGPSKVPSSPRQDSQRYPSLITQKPKKQQVPSVLATRQPEPLSRPKPTITPSSWRTDLRAHKLKSAKQQKETNIPQAEKKSDDYSDDFESDKENGLENKDKEPVAVKKTVRWKPRIVQPPAPPETPKPKERHYDPASVQRFIHTKKQQRANQSKEEHKVHEITAKQRAMHLKALHIRARQLVAVNVKRKKQGLSTVKNGNAKITPVYLQPNSTRSVVKPASPRKPVNTLPKFPMSHKLDDKFMAWFVSLHDPPPPRPVILSEQIKQAKLEATMRRAKERQEQQMTVNTATVSPSKVDKVQLSAPANSSSASLLQNPLSCLQADAAATKIQAVFRGYRTRKSLKNKLKLKEIKVPAVKQPVAFTVPFESWVQKSDADPFNFIQSVKRKLSEATKKDAIIQVTPHELESVTKEDKYESDFESSELSPSSSEEIQIGSDSQAASQHSLASVTPARSEDLCLQTSRSQSRSTPSQNLVAPNIALVLHDKKPEYSDSTLSKVSSQSSDSEASKSESTKNMVSPPTLPKPTIDLFTQQNPHVLNIDLMTQVIAPKVSSGQESFKKFDLQQSIRIEDSSALSVSDTNIKDLEMSIEAGFGRLTEEINAVRLIFGLPSSHVQEFGDVGDFHRAQEQRRSVPLDDAQFLVPDVHIFPKFDSTSMKPNQPLFEPPRKMSLENGDNSSQQSQSSTTETIEDEVEPCSEANSGGLPRVVEAAAELERSIQCAKGNLKQVAEHASLEEISEHVSIQYSSKFEEIASEEAGSGKSAYCSDTPTASEISTEALDERGKTKSKEKLRSSSDRDSQRQGTSSSEQDSFTVFSLAMFQQLVRDQELRARHQRALLKQREDAIFEKSKAELILLENQKRQLRSSGMESSIPGIKKRQRAILMRLNQERDEIKRLRESHKMASQERRLMLQQQQHIAKMRIAARELSSKLQDKDLPIKSQRLLEQPRRPRLAPSEEESSAASLSLDTSDLSQGKLSSGAEEAEDASSLRETLQKQISSEINNKRLLPMPATQQVLESDQDSLANTEILAKVVDTEEISAQQSNLQDLSTSPLPPTDEVFSVLCADVVEEVCSRDVTSELTKPSETTIEVDSKLSSAQESKLYTTESFESESASSTTPNTAHSKEQVPPTTMEEPKVIAIKAPVTIKIPLSPRLQGRQKRRHSSGSDESIVLSQPETASEQSDVESRICALQEQLRRRKLEADRLRREQKRCHRERLRAKEQSLLKQIQAYDSYIQEARRELEQEFEIGLANAGAVKPQIKQPRVAEKIMRRSEYSEPNSSEPKISEPIKSVEPNAISLSLNIVEEQQVPLNEISTGSEATSVPTDSSVQEIVEAVKSESDVESQDNQSIFENLSIAQNQSIAEDLESIISRKESIVETLESCGIIDEETSNVVATDETSPQKASEEIVEEVDLSSEKDVEKSIEVSSENVQVDESPEKDGYSSEFFSPENVTTSATSQKDDEEIEVETPASIHLEGDRSPESPESYSADSSVETTIESPRRPLVDSEAKQEHSDDDISENLQEDVSQGEEKEDETSRITSYLFQLLLSETMQCTCKQIEVKKEVATDQRCTEVDRIAENISKNLLDEALAQLFPIYKQRMAKLTEEKTESSTTHSILERVHTLLANTEASPAREAPRPQDLMMTTYIEEILSPEPDECVDLAKDVADHPEVPNKEVAEEKVELIKEEGPRCEAATEPAEAQIQQPADVPAAAEDKNESDEATAQLQDWFDEDFGLSSTRREAEELRLQQLQIEQEIEQLQAQQYPYYYVREIPNKPPPPYTPPGEIPKSPDEAEEIPGAVPSSKEQVLPLVSRAVETLYHARLAGRDLESVQAAWTPDTEQESEACVAYKQFIFDLCKELVQEAYCCSDKESPPWLEPPAVNKRKKLLMPKSLQSLQNRVEEKVMALLGFSTRVRREKLIIRWSRKRRDHVDELLVREAQEEEQAWTNYELDEAAVKSQISDAILSMLLTETATAIEKSVASKAQKLGAQSENQS